MLEKGNIQKLEIYSDVYRNWMYAQKMEEKGNLKRYCQLLTLKELEDIVNWCKELENKVIFSEEELGRVGRIRKTIQIVEKVRSHHKKLEGSGINARN